MLPVQSDTVESLEVRDAILGDDLVLNRTSRGGLVIHSVNRGAPRELGCFSRTVDAWKAIDVVDLAARSGDVEARRTA